MSPAALASDIARRRERLKKLTGRRPPRRNRLPRQLQPDGIRLRYFQALRAMLQYALWLVELEVIPILPALIAEEARAYGDSARLDASGKRLNDLLDEITERFFQRFSVPQMERLAEEYGRATSSFQREQLGKQVRAAIGIDVLPSEPWLAHEIAQFVAENVALIKSLPQQFFDQVEQVTIAGVRSGLRHEEIATLIEKDKAGKATDRAKLISRDQVGKLFGNLNEIRQQKLGIDSYIWRTVQDSRVRPDHVEREGRRYSWDDPPEDGHPGEPVNCRCWAEPVLDDLLSESE